MAKRILNDRTVKYVKARAKGKNKAESKREAGYAESTTTTDIEKSADFKALTMKDEILEQIDRTEIAEVLSENIRQRENLNASNKAIELATTRFIEPDKAEKKEQEQVIIVMKKG